MNNNGICRMKLNMYGTPETRVFNDGIVAHTEAGGYKQSKYELCLFLLNG